MKTLKATIEIDEKLKEVEIYYDKERESSITIAIDRNQVTVMQESEDAF